MEPLKQILMDEMKACMKAKNKDRLGTIRLILSAIKQIEVDERIELDNARIISVLDKMLKQRRESIKQYREGQREDLALIEEAEVVVIQSFLPKPLTDAEIEEMIAAAIVEVGATSVKDMGKIMGLLKAAMQGRADMAMVGTKIKAALSA
ncbi:MAG: hypothetical protein RL637_859 [Pseudomonadota bacterium]|jgi:uncharacterized protein YqeY